MLKRRLSQRNSKKNLMKKSVETPCAPVTCRSLMKGSITSETLAEMDEGYYDYDDDVSVIPSSLELTIPEPTSSSKSASAAVAVAVTMAVLPPISSITTVSTFASSYASTSTSSSSSSTDMVPIFLGNGEVCILHPEVEAKGAKDVLAALTEHEKAGIPDPTMPLRHFRAEKGNLEKAIQKIKATLAWRKEFEVDRIIRCMDPGTDDLEFRAMMLEENETGKMYTRASDNTGRAAVYMRPHFENTHIPLNNMRHLVYQLERACAVTHTQSIKKNEGGVPLEKINLMIDFGGFRIRDSPPMSTTKWTIDILQNHYPERLHRAYILNPGLVFRMFIPMVRPFLDPVTKDKLCLCSGSANTKMLIGRDYNIRDVEVAAGGAEGAVKDFDSRIYLEDIPFNLPY